MKKVVKAVIIVLILIEGVFIHLTFKSFSKGNARIENVNYKSSNFPSNKDMFAYYIDDGEGNFKEVSDGSAWPNDDKYNFVTTKCYDANGELNGSRVVKFNKNSDNNTFEATVNTSSTIYCYVYFSVSISPSDLSSENLETMSELKERNKDDDLRRFIGTKDEVTDNFICFGTTDQKECTDNMDTYMYRIIGVDTEGRLKLIKATKIISGDTNTFNWSECSDSNWNYSLCGYLDGNNSTKYFIGNSKYSYMNNGWKNLISPAVYYTGSQESSSATASGLFSNERSAKTSVGRKVGLMYPSDYLYAGPNDATNWLNPVNGLNGTSNTPEGSLEPGGSEWTMTYSYYHRYSDGDEWYYSWGVDSNGLGQFIYWRWYADGDPSMYFGNSVRPVFYVIPTVKITDGDGSIESPYILESFDEIIERNSHSLESEEELAARNETITAAGGNKQDDLRRFIGTKDEVTDNFICFGTDDKDTCTSNMDLYMYRIIGIDTQNRLKIIKATKIKNGSTSTFYWHSSNSSDIYWSSSYLYNNLNGSNSKIFWGNSKYSYISNSKWYGLILSGNYYNNGVSTVDTMPELFKNESTNTTYVGYVSLMNLSDYVYANKGTSSTDNWLFIENGLNGESDGLGDGAEAPKAEKEWTISRYGKDGSYYHAWYVNEDSTPAHERMSSNYYAVRPVLYLNGTAIKDGKGTIDEPYVIYSN